MRGEVCLVVSGAGEPEAPDPAALLEQVRERVAAGQRLKDAAGEVARTSGASARTLYEAFLKARRAP